MAQSSKYKISDTGGFGNDDNALSAKQLLRNFLASAQRSLPLAGTLYFISEQMVPASHGLIDSSAFATKSSSTNVWRSRIGFDSLRRVIFFRYMMRVKNT